HRGIARSELLVRKTRADLRQRRRGPGNGDPDQIQNTANRLIEDWRGQRIRIKFADKGDEIARCRHADARSILAPPNITLERTKTNALAAVFTSLQSCRPAYRPSPGSQPTVGPTRCATPSAGKC